MRTIHRTIDDPARLGFWTFTVAVLVQFLHQNEHLLQIVQKNLWGWQELPGLLGSVFDFEWVHFLYNTALFLSVLSVVVTFFKNPGMWRRSRAGLFGLIFATVFQGYHLLEHSARMVQYLGGTPKPLGLVGQIVPVVELHFWINSVVIAALVVAYACFRPTPYGPLRRPAAARPTPALSSTPSNTTPAPAGFAR
jgi:hypothetical protein